MLIFSAWLPRAMPSTQRYFGGELIPAVIALTLLETFHIIVFIRRLAPTLQTFQLYTSARFHKHHALLQHMHCNGANLSSDTVLTGSGIP